MSGFWKGFAKVLVKTAQVSAAAALWASQHPEVIQGVVAIAEQAKAPTQK